MTNTELNVYFIVYVQAKFGATGTDDSFRMFESAGGKDLLFKEKTKCLQEVESGSTYDKFLGPEYMSAMKSLRQCGSGSGWYYG